ncbi:MAG: HD domain-containing protein [Candidatus Pacearchaeota archaeon]|nr:HD domain-containing protein [Candidatus Pacearchaeota archaeon]
MEIESLKKEIKEKFFANSGCHDFDHTLRVLNLCMHLGKGENADIEILSIAAILHDIAREEEKKSGGKICHAERGAMLSRQILEEKGLEREKIEKIIHCIECHRYRKNRIPETKEAKILFDADKLDSIGAIGIGRAFVFAGEIGARVHNKDIKVEETESYSKEDTAYREFLVKLRNIKDKMLTDEGKKFAEERHQFMFEFFDRLNKEVDGEV